MTPHQLLTTEFKRMGVKFDMDMIQSDARFAENIYLRRVACDILNRHGFTYNEIGRVINREHSAVIHMLEHIPDWDKATVLHNAILYHQKQIKDIRIKLSAL